MTLTIPAGSTSVRVDVVINDTVNEADEYFNVNLNNANNDTIADNQGIGTILNDDSIPAISTNDVTITEN